MGREEKECYQEATRYTRKQQASYYHPHYVSAFLQESLSWNQSIRKYVAHNNASSELLPMPWRYNGGTGGQQLTHSKSQHLCGQSSHFTPQRSSPLPTGYKTVTVLETVWAFYKTETLAVFFTHLNVISSKHLHRNIKTLYPNQHKLHKWSKNMTHIWNNGMSKVRNETPAHHCKVWDISKQVNFSL